ncbi:efflux RND transporter permease subunit [Steroidobacter agaridevorans]|uniref:efflux RND transporter permease subunit n=1 Tax=Steroidobacter agaridevorans TaxID=2695856 RepID=UPI001325A1A4|nr:MMPL family transporter [Steroidobacter agaridevorans]GFE86013.1 membrane protein [Steroidobacter agaridevorans]
MKRVLQAIAEHITHVPERLQRRKLLVLTFFALATAVFCYGLTQLKFDFTLERWFEQDDASFIAYNEFHEQFGSEDGVVIVYKAKDGDVFSAQSLQAVQGIREELLNYHKHLKEGEVSALDHIVDVDCLINAFILTVKDDILLSSGLVGNTVPTDRAALEDIRRRALSQRDFPLKFFSKDMQYAAIYIKTDFGAIPLDSDEKPASGMSIDMAQEIAAAASTEKKGPPRFKPTDTADYLALNAALKVILEKPQFAEHLEYYKVGSTIESEHQLEMGKEVAVLYLAALTIMLVSLLLVFRSLSAVVWSFLIVILSTIWTLGIAGLAGLAATPFVTLTILLILTMGMADVVHIISGYLFFRNEGHDFKAAVRMAYEKAGVACLLTAITAMAGMLSLLFTNLVPIKHFSIMSATGVVVALFLTLYLLPVLLDLWAPVPKVKKASAVMQRLMPNVALALQKRLDKVLPVVEKRPRTFVALFSVVLAVCIYGAFHVKVDYTSYDQYPKESNFYRSIKLLDEEMAGSARVSLYVDLGKDNGFQDPEVLRAVEAMQRKLETDYRKYVVTTSSIVDIVKDANQKQNEGRPEMYKIPDSQLELSQTLFMFNTADPEEREKVVSENYRKANITVTLRTFGSNEYTDVFAAMKQDVNDTLSVIKKTYPEATVSITGLFSMGLQAADYLMTNELQSFGLSLLVISLILLIIFNSFKAGFISLVPNLIPSFLVLGILGLLDFPIDFYTMMLAPIVVGIAVDDTIHFVSQYRAEVLKDGDIRRALRDTVKECGQGIVFTSLVLGLGFGIMSIASSPGLANLGKLGFLSIFSGLLCELFLTPALIMVFKLNFASQRDEQRVEPDPVPGNAQA